MRIIFPSHYLETLHKNTIFLLFSPASSLSFHHSFFVQTPRYAISQGSRMWEYMRGLIRILDGEVTRKRGQTGTLHKEDKKAAP